MAAPGEGRRVALLAPMQEELRPLVRRLRLRPEAGGSGLFTGRRAELEIVALRTGIGTRAAARAAEAVLAGRPLERVVVVGIAGAIGADLAPGDLIVPEVVLDLARGTEYRPAPLGDAVPRGALATSDRLIRDPGEIADLERRGVVAIDMETAAVAAVCERRSCPWSVFRAISDRADDASVDPEILGLAAPDGRGDPAAVARLLLRRPWRLPRLVRLAGAARRAADVAARVAVAALEAA